MSEQSRLIVILHADVVGSTSLVLRDEIKSHDRIQDTFRRFAELITAAGGEPLELRGDALIAQFARASDAVTSALAFQADNTAAIRNLGDDIRPELRVGIALGEVVVADSTVTGAGVVLAQRLEQRAAPGGVCVSAAVREALPGRLGLGIDDLGEHELKGFVEAQRVYRVRSAGNAVADEMPASPSADAVATSKPSIAVLPFDNMSNDPEQAYFADGLTEELITALSRSDDLFVIARNSSFAFRGGNVDVQHIGAQLGARYLLEGSVQKAGQRVRITAQLIETASRQHVWAERFDGTVEDLFDLQDAVTEQIVGQLLPSVERAETVRVSRGHDHTSSAYDLYLRATHHFHAFSRTDIEAAFRYLDMALSQSPDFARALALAGVCSARMVINSWDVENDAKYIEYGLRHASRAPALEPNDSTVLWMSGFAIGRLSGDYGQGIELLERATQLNPNSYIAYGFAGLLKSIIERSEEAIVDLERSIRLNPIDPRSFTFYTSLAKALTDVGRFEDAKRRSAQAIQQNPRYDQAHREFIASLYLSGQEAELSSAVTRFMALFPEFTVARLKARNERLRVPTMPKQERHFQVLIDAGVPEG